VRVAFYKLTEQRVSYWEAVRGKRTLVPGSAMALGRGDTPHDLVQLVVEATLGIDRGFWGSVALGATFRSTGRKRTKPGRDVIRENRQELDEAEQLAGLHVERWRTGAATPCAEALDAVARRWEALADGEGLVVEWPTLADLGTTTGAVVGGSRRSHG
jgi:hypothetical protein